MEKNIPVFSESHYERFIYNDVNFVKNSSIERSIVTALQLIETENEKKLCHELELGEQSRMIKNFNPQKHLAELHKKYA